MNAFPFPRGRFPRIGIDEVVVADTETTGLFPLGVDDDGAPCAGEWGPDRLCSLAAVRLRAVGGAWEMGDVVQWLVDPGRPVPEVAARINGFAWSGDGAPVPAGRVDLFGRPSFAEIAEEFLSFVGDASLVCHNIVFDVAVLDAELVRAGMSPLRGPVLCTKKAYSDIQGLGRPNRYVAGTNLNKLCDALGVDRSSRVGPDGEELHGAAVDARLAARCFALLEPQGWIEIEDPASLPLLREVSVCGGEFDPDDLPAGVPKDWHAVSDQSGVIACFAREEDAYAYRLFLINLRLDGARILERYREQDESDRRQPPWRIG